MASQKDYPIAPPDSPNRQDFEPLPAPPKRASTGEGALGAGLAAFSKSMEEQNARKRSRQKRY